MKNFGFPAAIGATALAATLVTFPFLPLSRADEPEPQRVTVVSATEEATTATVLPPEPRPATGEKTKRATRERLAREQAAAQEPAAQEPAAQAESVDKETERPQKAGASVSVLPGLSREVSREEAPPAEDRYVRVPPGVVTGPEPADDELSVSIPRLGIEDVPVGDSPDQEYLDREGIMHLTGTDFPYERGSNTYIVGHAADFGASRVPNVFQDLNDLRPGDTVTLRDSTGRSYELPHLRPLRRRAHRRLGHGPHRRQEHRLAPDLLPGADLRETPHRKGTTGQLTPQLMPGAVSDALHLYGSR